MAVFSHSALFDIIMKLFITFTNIDLFAVVLTGLFLRRSAKVISYTAASVLIGNVLVVYSPAVDVLGINAYQKGFGYQTLLD